MTNFTNGALVFRIWRFDGSGEVIAKFQYMSDAEAFAQGKATEDAGRRPVDAAQWFYLVACESECRVKAFEPIKQKREDRPIDATAAALSKSESRS